MTKKHTTTRALRQGAERRQNILDAASRLFSRAGFHHATIADIANEVGITQAGVLHHFPTKREILFAVLMEREERNASSETERHQAGKDYLQSFLETLRENEKTPVLVQLFAILSSESIFEDHPAHEFFVERYRRIVMATTEALEPVVDTDRLPAGATVETVARWVIAAADGLRLQWLLDPEAVSRPVAMEQLFEVLRPLLRDSKETRKPAKLAH